jgi:hypothetical protein
VQVTQNDDFSMTCRQTSDSLENRKSNLLLFQYFEWAFSRVSNLPHELAFSIFIVIIERFVNMPSATP